MRGLTPASVGCLCCFRKIFEPFDGTVRLSLFHFFDGFFGVTFAYNFCNTLGNFFECFDSPKVAFSHFGSRLRRMMRANSGSNKFCFVLSGHFLQFGSRANFCTSLSSMFEATDSLRNFLFLFCGQRSEFFPQGGNTEFAACFLRWIDHPFTAVRQIYKRPIGPATNVNNKATFNLSSLFRGKIFKQFCFWNFFEPSRQHFFYYPSFVGVALIGWPFVIVHTFSGAFSNIERSHSVLTIKHIDIKSIFISFARHIVKITNKTARNNNVRLFETGL